MAKKKEEVVEKTTEVKVINPEDILIENEKKERRSRFFDELIAFLVLAVIIAVLALAGWYWYTHVYSNNENEKGKVNVSDEDGFKYISYITEDNNYLDVLNDEYVVLYDDTSVLKIMDLDLNTIYENEVEFTDYFMGTDDNLYFYLDEQLDEGNNKVTLYRLENNDLVKVKELENESTYYRPIIVMKDDKELFTGFNGIYSDEAGNTKEYIYLLTGKEYELSDINIVSDEPQVDVAEPIYLSNEKLAIYINNAGDKYGAYNIADNAQVIDANYDALYRDKNSNNFIAKKGNKFGIIDTSLRKIVDYNYDFIDADDGFYIVGKDNKLALMDSSYKLVTNFVFDYQDPEDMGYLYHECCGNYNSFETYKIKDKYLLVTNINDLFETTNYSKHEAYLIDQTGTFKTFKENEFDVDILNNVVWFYDDDTKEFTFYDLDFNELYKLNFKDYDYDRLPTFTIAYGTLKVSFLNTNLYYELKTGKILSNINDYEEKVLDDITFKLDGKEQKIKVSLKDKEIFTSSFGFDEGEKLYHVIDDDIYLYYNNQTYFMIRKGD